MRRARPSAGLPAGGAQNPTTPGAVREVPEHGFLRRGGRHGGDDRHRIHLPQGRSLAPVVHRRQRRHESDRHRARRWGSGAVPGPRRDSGCRGRRPPRVRRPHPRPRSRRPSRPGRRGLARSVDAHRRHQDVRAAGAGDRRGGHAVVPDPREKTGARPRAEPGNNPALGPRLRHGPAGAAVRVGGGPLYPGGEQTRRWHDHPGPGHQGSRLGDAASPGLVPGFP